MTEVDGLTLDDLVLNDSLDPSSPLRSRLLAESFSLQPRTSFRNQQPSPVPKREEAVIEKKETAVVKEEAAVVTEEAAIDENHSTESATGGEDSNSKALQDIV